MDIVLGCEMVTGDMNDKDSLLEATRGAHGVFIITDFYVTCKQEDEIRQVDFFSKIFHMKLYFKHSLVFHMKLYFKHSSVANRPILPKPYSRVKHPQNFNLKEHYKNIFLQNKSSVIIHRYCQQCKS